MKATQLLRNLGQSIWLDNITRDLLINGTLKRYIDELSVTGLTSNQRFSTRRLSTVMFMMLPSVPIWHKEIERSDFSIWHWRI